MELIPAERIEQKILLVRGQKVILDHDLATLYLVATRQLKRAVNRNKDRFPGDFMFQLTADEYRALRCHFGTLKRGAHAKYLPYAFTELGVAMLSSVLTSKRAVQINMQIMRAFVHLKEMISSHKELRNKIEELEKKYDHQFKVVFDVIKKLMETETTPKKKIGYIK